MNPTLIDTHCHLTSEQLVNRRDEVARAAVEAGVARMITVTCRASELPTAMALRETHVNVWIASGIHPHEAGRVSTEEIATVVASWTRPGVVAAGEMGLDYHYDFSPRDVQQDVFRRQLDLAAPTGLPIIIHAREAQADVIRILEAAGYRNRPVVFHCFSGTREEAAEIRSYGWRTSFTGLITFKNAAEQQAAMLDTPADQLMFETDSPYLSPEPVRKIRPNEPRNLVHTVRFAAMLMGRPWEEVAERSTRNAEQFFRLS